MGLLINCGTHICDCSFGPVSITVYADAADRTLFDRDANALPDGIYTEAANCNVLQTDSYWYGYILPHECGHMCVLHTPPWPLGILRYLLGAILEPLTSYTLVNGGLSGAQPFIFLP